MPIAKKQFEFAIRGRGIATSTAGVVSQANMTFPIDAITVNGREIKLSDLDSTQRAAIIAAVELLIATYAGIS